MPRRVLVLSLCLMLSALGNQAVLVVAPPATPAQSAAIAGPTASDRRDQLGWKGTRAVDPTPVRQVIPSINLDAKVEARGLDNKRNLDTARDFQHVAWYDLGPAPGQAGNALMNGHVNWWTGNAVFTYLARVRVGDRVEVIRADGTTVTFRITAKRVVGANARVASLFAPSTVATLTLITCTGAWNPLTQSDTQRLLVSATVA